MFLERLEFVIVELVLFCIKGIVMSEKNGDCCVVRERYLE